MKIKMIRTMIAMSSAALLLAACITETPRDKVQVGTQRHNEISALINSSFEAQNNGDVEGFLNLMYFRSDAPDCVTTARDLYTWMVETMWTEYLDYELYEIVRINDHIYIAYGMNYFRSGLDEDGEFRYYHEPFNPYIVYFDGTLGLVFTKELLPEYLVGNIDDIPDNVEYNPAAISICEIEPI